MRLCLERHSPYFLPFMSERRQLEAEGYLRSLKFDNFMFFGGADVCERKMLGIFDGEADSSLFPISAVCMRFAGFSTLTHRDFLGALMSLGIERSSVGDILVEDGRCVVFVKSELCGYVKLNLSKVGAASVRFCDFSLSDLPVGRGVDEAFYTVSSLRLDNTVSAVTCLSREKTKRLILSGDVCADFRVAQNVSAVLKEGAVFTVKGKGKFILKKVIGETRKGRIKISVIHYR